MYRLCVFDEVKMIFLCFKVIFIVFIIFGNSFVFKVFYKFLSLWIVFNIILVSLFIVDSLMVLFFVFYISFIVFKFEKSGLFISFWWLCILSVWLSFVFIFVIILYLVLISVECVIVVKYFLRYNIIVINCWVVIVFIIVWLWVVVVMFVFF